MLRLVCLTVCLLAVNGLCSGVLRGESPSSGSPSAPRPNIIFILCDDLGWGDLGVFYQNQLKNHPRFHTPQLDQMAEQGVQLRAHYCPAPVCAPSRSSLLSGVHQGHAEVRDNQFDKALADNHTLGTVLQQAGYRTALIGKYGLQGDGENPQQWPAYPTRRGFDEFYGYVRHRDGHVHYPADHWPLGNSEGHRQPHQVWHNDREVSEGLQKCYTTDLFTARSKHWIAEHRREHGEQPFFLYLAYDTPHAALQVPTGPYPEGRGLDGGVQWLGQPGRMINTAEGTIDSYRHPDYADRGWDDVAVRFATMVRRIDAAVGDLLETLRDLDIDRETLVVFSSDNGPHHESYIAGKQYDPTAFKSYGRFDGTKRDTWEGGIRVPTLAWWPGGITEERIDQTPSQFHDWMPTFAELAGVLPPARSDGVSLVPTLTGNGEQSPGTVYVEYAQSGRTRDYADFGPEHRRQKRGQMQVIHVDGYKGIRVDIQNADDPFRIYDLQQDPQERSNLADTSDRFRRLQRKMQARVLRVRRPNATAPRPYDEALVPAVRGEELHERRAGLQWRFLAGQFDYVPNLRHQTPTETGSAESLDLGAVTSEDVGAVEWTGWIEVPADGAYTFALKTDGRALLRLHDATVIDADAGYESGTQRTGTIRLEQGLHPIRLTCLKPASGGQLRLTWAEGDGPQQPIPASAWQQGR
ncbi:sulfatase-like hydrolase/transferase [Roseimaritima sediminicola]|uniref:sulfatase-like hydrolase/transferase n=1 Tax=Roseimaritima sediminicola TaxID=2662066 RepID=UPI0012983F9B|nr:sulfatase-like hydrolase/transferase [Roseimaritima sediminicola]